MNKELTKEEAEEYYNKLWLENKELIQKSIDKLNSERFELQLELVDKNKEIERLNNIIKGLDNTIENLEEVVEHKDNVIKEVREYIDSFNLPKDLGVLGEAPISISELKHILEILDKEK